MADTTPAPAFSEEQLALTQAAHEEVDFQNLLEAYKAMELAEDHLWVQKHVRPDSSTFVLHTDDCSAFGTSGLDFSWAIGQIVIKAQVDPTKLDISYSVAINYLEGTKELISVTGNLKDTAKGEVNAAFAEGTTMFFLKNNKEVWLELKLSSPLFPTLDKEFKIIKICESQ